MYDLQGKTVILTGTRKMDELSRIVQNLGGTAILRPLQGTVEVDEQDVEAGLQGVLETSYHWLVFTTSLGVELLHRAAISAGKERQFLQVLQCTHIAARGYKTVRYLKSLGIVDIVRDEDGTSTSLLHRMADRGISDQRVLLQLPGNRFRNSLPIFGS